MAYGKHMRQVEPLFFADVWTTTMHMYNIYIYKTYPYDFPWNFQLEWSNKGYKYKQILFADDVSIRIIRAGQYQPQQISTHNKAIDA